MINTTLSMDQLPGSVRKPANARSYWNAAPHREVAKVFADRIHDICKSHLAKTHLLRSPMVALSADKSFSVISCPMFEIDGMVVCVSLTHCTNMRQRSRLFVGVHLPKHDVGFATVELEFPRCKNTDRLGPVTKAADFMSEAVEDFLNGECIKWLGEKLPLHSVNAALLSAIERKALPLRDLPAVQRALQGLEGYRAGGRILALDLMRVLSATAQRGHPRRRLEKTLALAQVVLDQTEAGSAGVVH